jgi:hypothetical protein
MLSHGEYVIMSIKNFKWRDTMYAVKYNKTKSWS